MAVKRQPHLILRSVPSSEPFEPIGKPVAGKLLPVRDRKLHAENLLSQLDRVRQEATTERDKPVVAALGRREGLHIQFELEAPYMDALKSLEDRGQGIELLAATEVPGRVHATVYVPPGKLDVIEKKITRFGTKDTRAQRPRNEKLVATIIAIRTAAVRDFWTDAAEEFPEPGSTVRWEVWIREDDHAIEQFETRAPEAGLQIKLDSFLAFPDRRVYLAVGTLEQMTASVEVLDAIAELRRAKESREFFARIRGPEGKGWVDDLVSRLVYPPSDAAAVCLLDSGLNAGHLLIRPFVADREILAARPEWDATDGDSELAIRGHGTRMAGLSLYGDLAGPATNSNLVKVYSRLESVRILNSAAPTPRELHGVITKDAVNLIEIVNPIRERIFSMSVTTADYRDRGQPSSWSSELDQLAFGGTDEALPRLFIVSAGNSDRGAWSKHPDHLATDLVHDAGQAWNALTVGACTRLWSIEEKELDGWLPLAEAGDLSPSTSTSRSWDQQWPLKPDIVMDGGNCAIDGDGVEVDTPDSLSLLTTSHEPLARPFVTVGDTSAACSLVAQLAARLRSTYPRFWPETIRGLLVHSAEWTEVMKRRYLRGDRRADREELIRYCGFGEPSVDRALWSAGNDLTLVAQSQIQPFKEVGTDVKMNEMHLHEIPWPRQALQDLGELEVELQVTLSYFVEPNPARRGWTRRHRYASHGLRFDINTPNEKPREFRARINQIVRRSAEAEGIDHTSSDSREWDLGSDLRGKGSIHSDRWRGTAVALADRKYVGVFPVGGWWKERSHFGRGNRKVRYSLLVSVRTPLVDVDLYTPVKLSLEVPIAIDV